MKKSTTLKLLAIAMAFIFVLPGCQSNKNILDPKRPVYIEIWHYYNGTQKIAFDEMVMEFNETVGLEKGIIVDAFSQGNINDLEEKIIESVQNKVGANEIPNIFTAYADTAFKVEKLGLLVDLDQYFTSKEIDEYIDAYIEEGRCESSGKLTIFPILKSTELMMINKTDWDAFSKATGATTEDLKTWEDLAEVAKKYYDWSGGKAFFGRDAMANYMLVGSKQLGKEMFLIEKGKASYNGEDKIIRRLWDNFYLPYISGYYGAYGKFRSDDAKTGDIIALVGSTSSAAYFPDTVTIGDNKSYPIEAMMLPLPNFKNTAPCAVQQGAGMAVIQSDPSRELASAEFLRWFTQTDRNIKFSIATGYMPVKKVANNMQTIEEHLHKEENSQVSKQLRLSLPVAINQANTYELFTSKAFENGIKARAILTKSLIDKAKADREEVVKLIDHGMLHEEAIQEVATDENFNQWLVEFKANLQNEVDQVNLKRDGAI